MEQETIQNIHTDTPASEGVFKEFFLKFFQIPAS